MSPARPFHPTPLDELLWRLADGDRAAFSPAFAELWPIVVRYNCRWLRDPRDAEDAAQQALEKVFARAAELDRMRPPLGWVLALATWECRTFRRKNQRSREVALGTEERPADGPNPEQYLEERRIAEALESALGALSAEDRATLIDTIREETPAGIAPATFRKRRERAIDRLRMVWRTLHGST